MPYIQGLASRDLDIEETVRGKKPLRMGGDIEVLLLQLRDIKHYWNHQEPEKMSKDASSRLRKEPNPADA